MILLFNLNTYIGGGETLLIRLAQYLRFVGLPYQILTAGGDCWILKEATRLELNCDVWPATRDSVNYQTSAQRHSVVSAMDAIYSNIKELRIFTFCMRDMHNAQYVFTRLPHIKVYFSHGVYHPEDVYYLSSLSIQPERIIDKNRDLVRLLYEKQSILFMNRHGLNISLGKNASYNLNFEYDSLFVPIPIPITKEIIKNEIDPLHPLKIICISRFVDFKIAAILSMFRYAGNRPGVELFVIGHGRWKLVLTAWMKLNRIRNIVIKTGVSPEELDAYIDNSDIGYAQGTSILEIAKRGRPVIIAPYSRIIDLFNTRFPTLGVFGEVQGPTSFGDITDLKGLKTYSIADCIEAVCRDYERYQKMSTEFVNTFSSDIVCKKITNLIVNAKFSNQHARFDPPRAPLIKRILKMTFGLGA